TRRRVHRLWAAPRPSATRKDRVGGPAVTAREVSEPNARPDLRQRYGRGFLRLSNPVVRRMISAGLPTGAPNILRAVRGRRSLNRRPSLMQARLRKRQPRLRI